MKLRLALIPILLLASAARAETLYGVGMADQFKVFAILAEACDQSGRLVSGDSYTVFAPKNTAFGKVPRRLLNEMWEPGEHWAKTFWHHIVKGSFPPEALSRLDKLKPLSGGELRIGRSGTRLTVNGHGIIESKVVSNGVVYTLDSVLIPEEAASYFAR